MIIYSHFLIANIQSSWAIFYDTIYGCQVSISDILPVLIFFKIFTPFVQDREDDIKIGVKSTSLLFGDRVREILAVFAAGFVSAIAVAGYLNH